MSHYKVMRAWIDEDKPSRWSILDEVARAQSIGWLTVDEVRDLLGFDGRPKLRLIVGGKR